MQPPPANLTSAIKALAWAAFLGSSWTWCIGMFLPVLLIRDMGLWGWIVFAVPNVIGAALMGWVLKSPQSSRRLVDAHRGACRAFSAVTIVFHVFFILWFIPRLTGLPSAASAFALAGAYLLMTFSRPGSDLIAAALAWLVSLILGALFLRTPAAILPAHTLLPNLEALYLTPVCLLGFALCPYLDLTFHRARQAQPSQAQSRFVFGAGFGVFFFLMIVFSALYARALAPLVAADWRAHLRPAFGWIIATHVIVQSAFTMSAHARALADSRITPGGVFAFLVAGQLAIFAAIASAILPRFFHLDPGELIYRIFMSFYGLVFPAYVWICMVPRRSAQVAVPAFPAVRRALLAIVVASPMYWLGFIQDRMVWLLPAVLFILFARFVNVTSAPQSARV